SNDPDQQPGPPRQPWAQSSREGGPGQCSAGFGTVRFFLRNNSKNQFTLALFPARPLGLARRATPSSGRARTACPDLPPPPRPPPPPTAAHLRPRAPPRPRAAPRPATPPPRGRGGRPTPPERGPTPPPATPRRRSRPSPSTTLPARTTRRHPLAGRRSSRCRL